jgi:hypothetical protein
LIFYNSCYLKNNLLFRSTVFLKLFIRLSLPSVLSKCTNENMFFNYKQQKPLKEKWFSIYGYISKLHSLQVIFFLKKKKKKISNHRSIKSEDISLPHHFFPSCSEDSEIYERFCALSKLDNCYKYPTHFLHRFAKP